TITTPDGVTATPSPASADLETAGAEGDEATFTITLSLTTTSSNITMPDINNLSVAMEFNKFVEEALPLYVENNKLFVNMGTDPDTGNPIRWYAIAKDNATLKETEFTNISQATAGTYVFISEYILENSEGGDSIAFNYNMTAENNWGANYGGSTIQTYINGTGTGSMDARYNFSSSDVWAKIEPKDCESETVQDYAIDSDVTIPATNDQTLWLLSYNEYNSWFGDGDSSGEGYLLNSTSSTGNWWLRSAYGVYSDVNLSGVKYVYGHGALDNSDAGSDSHGARPAFQITIA
ncbi:MAG: hypothetical protein IJ318_02465, partial [Clostridia bacterium]|nr:hypothetical protein [Clostridia bacterium]